MGPIPKWSIKQRAGVPEHDRDGGSCFLEGNTEGRGPLVFTSSNSFIHSLSVWINEWTPSVSHFLPMCVISCESGFSSLTSPVSFYLSISAYGGRKKRDPCGKDRIWSYLDHVPAAMWTQRFWLYAREKQHAGCTGESTHTYMRSLCLHTVTPLINKFITTSKGRTGDRSQRGRPGVNPSKRL